MRMVWFILSVMFMLWAAPIVAYAVSMLMGYLTRPRDNRNTD